MRGVATLPSTVRIPAPARTMSNAAVKFGPRPRIMNLTRCACPPGSVIGVAGLLGGPFPGWVQSDCEDADAPGGVLDHGQNMGLGAAGQAGREQAAPGSPRPGSARIA